MGDVNLSISKEVVEPIIEAKVNAAVCEALGGSHDIVSDVVTKMLNMKVDDKGKYSSYSSNLTFIQWLCRNAIRDAATAAIKNYINSANDKIVKAVESHLNKKTKSVAVGMVNAFLQATESEWKLKVDVAMEAPKSEY